MEMTATDLRANMGSLIIVVCEEKCPEVVWQKVGLMDPSHFTKEDETSLMITLLNEGKTYREVADYFDLTPDTVHKRISRKVKNQPD